MDNPPARRNTSSPSSLPRDFHERGERLLADARQIIDNARASAIRSVDFHRVEMYWNLGKRIFEEEQHGKDRADYGAFIIRNLAKSLEADYGSGFRVRQLEQSRKFYRTYPIAHTLYAQLNWSQYKLLIAIADKDKREYYENKTIGILLCTDKNDTAVKIALPEDNKTIVASRYQLYLPTDEQIKAEIRRIRSSIEEAGADSL